MTRILVLGVGPPLPPRPRARRLGLTGTEAGICSRGSDWGAWCGRAGEESALASSSAGNQHDIKEERRSRAKEGGGGGGRGTPRNVPALIWPRHTLSPRRHPSNIMMSYQIAPARDNNPDKRTDALIDESNAREIYPDSSPPPNIKWEPKISDVHHRVSRHVTYRTGQLLSPPSQGPTGGRRPVSHHMTRPTSSTQCPLLENKQQAWPLPCGPYPSSGDSHTVRSSFASAAHGSTGKVIMGERAGGGGVGDKDQVFSTCHHHHTNHRGWVRGVWVWERPHTPISQRCTTLAFYRATELQRRTEKKDPRNPINTLHNAPLPPPVWGPLPFLRPMRRTRNSRTMPPSARKP